MPDNLSTAPHPLPHGGTSQTQRNLAALSPAFAPVDNRSEAELLEYVYQLARVVVYHEVEGDLLKKSDWQDFFRLSEPILLALTAKFDTESLRLDFDAALDNFNEGIGRGDIGPVLGRVFDLALLLNRWHRNLPDFARLKTDLQNLITNDLRHTFRQLVAVANEAEIKLGAAEYRRPQNLQPFLQNPVWEFSTSDLFLTGVPVSGTSAQAKGTLDDKKNFYRDRAAELFSVFLQGVERIVRLAQSPDYQKKSLEKFAGHQPHIGLLLAFTRLFKFVQDDLNSLGAKHLDFYLREVLGLKPKPAVPDQAHLVVELDKFVPKHPLKEDTLFKASAKDEKGLEMHFGLDSEVVLNQAQVAELRTLYREMDGGNLKNIRIAPAANSFDGKGLPFEDPNAAIWKTLGSLNSKVPIVPTPPTGIDFVKNDIARVGFLVASPTLLLNEGDGTVKIELKMSGNLPALAADLFRVFYSGKKKWETAAATVSALNSDTLEVEFTIPAGGEPLTFSDPAVLKTDFKTTDPIVRVELNPESVSWGGYDELLKLNVSEIKLEVTANKVRNLLLSNEEGVIDPNKPFMPFGAVPHLGSPFIVGSEEAFRKQNLTQLGFHFQWDKLPKTNFPTHYAGYANAPGANTDFKAKMFRLKNGNWEIPSLSEKDLFSASVPPNATPLAINFPEPEKVGKIAETLQPYALQSLGGFMKLELAGKDFLHADFPEELARKMLEITKSGISAATFTNLITTLDNANDDLVNAEADTNAAQAQLTSVSTSGSLIVANANIAIANAKMSNANSSISNAESDIDLSQVDISSAKTTINSIGAISDLPNPPYTPTIKEFYLSYTATSEWKANQTADIVFAHLHPFEEQNHAKQAEIGFKLLPEFAEEGTLYLGLKNLVPGSNLNLLFQMAEATADPDVPTERPRWQYLAGNKWSDLRPEFEVLDDATNGLIASGIVALSIPFAASAKDTTILPAGFHWLKVSLPNGTKGVSETVAVHAQAVKTTFEIQLDAEGKPLNDTARLSKPLPDNSIAKPVTDDAALKKIQQPYESFAGRPAEDDARFRLRASERLRHKGRSVSLYDYERMVLEQFPQIYKVKCLTHTHVFRPQTGAVRDFHLAPGHVALAVIPDITRFRFSEKLQPRASRALLFEIEEFLKKRSSPFVKIHAVNPLFQPVEIHTDVIFQKGKDADFHKKKLADDILAFLTPWAFGEQDKLSFGGKLFKSSVLRFVETLDYVDYVTNFKLRSQGDPTDDLAMVNALTERSIIASGEHKIQVPTNPCPPNSKDPSKTGLGFQKIEELKIASP